MRVYVAPKLLAIDEFGVWSDDRLAATALFSLNSTRYERGSIILTSNKGFGEGESILNRRNSVKSAPALTVASP